MSESESKQLEKNWTAFKEAEPSLLEKHFGRTALLHDGQIIAIYNDGGDAYTIGCEKFGLGHFSTQMIGEKPQSLGIFTSYVGG